MPIAAETEEPPEEVVVVKRPKAAISSDADVHPASPASSMSDVRMPIEVARRQAALRQRAEAATARAAEAPTQSSAAEAWPTWAAAAWPVAAAAGLASVLLAVLLGAVSLRP